MIPHTDEELVVVTEQGVFGELTETVDDPNVRRLKKKKDGTFEAVTESSDEEE